MGWLSCLLVFPGHLAQVTRHTLVRRPLALTSEASSRRGPQYTPLLAAAKAVSAACVLPEFVGPTCATTVLSRARAAGYQLAGEVRSSRCAASLVLAPAWLAIRAAASAAGDRSARAPVADACSACSPVQQHQQQTCQHEAALYNITLLSVPSSQRRSIYCKMLSIPVARLRHALARMSPAG